MPAGEARRPSRVAGHLSPSSPPPLPPRVQSTPPEAAGQDGLYVLTRAAHAPSAVLAQTDVPHPRLLAPRSRRRDLSSCSSSQDRSHHWRCWLHRYAAPASRNPTPAAAPAHVVDVPTGSHIALCCLLSGKYSVVTIDKCVLLFCCDESSPPICTEETREADHAHGSRPDSASRLSHIPHSFHNSFPTALERVTKIAQDELPEGASDEDKKALEIKCYRGDISIKSDIDQIFADYASKGGIWGVIHVAALKAVGESGEIPIKYYENNITATINLLDVRASSASPILETFADSF